MSQDAKHCKTKTYLLILIEICCNGQFIVDFEDESLMKWLELPSFERALVNLPICCNN